MNPPHTMGVVVIGRNEGERLQRCLRSLASAPCGVYVDSGSTDGSVAFARSLGVAVVELDMSRPFSMARARNAGFQHLRQLRPDLRLVQFVDGDCEVAAGWLEAAVAFLAARPDVAAVAGRRREQHPEHSIYNRLCDLEWNTAVGEARAVGGDALVRAEAFVAANGFNESLIAGEEPELCLRLRRAGWKIWRLDAEMTRHDANILTFRQWWRRMQRGGYGSLDVVTRLAATTPHADIPFGFMVRSARTWTLGWAGATLALAAALGLVMGPWWAAAGLGAGAALWLAQAARLGWAVRRRTPDLRTALAHGGLTLLGKWAQVTGQWRYRRDTLAGRGARLIEYKEDSPMTPWQADRARYPESAFFREQSLWAIAVYRFGCWNDARPRGVTRWFNDRLYWFLFRIVETLTGVSFTKAVQIGPGLRVYHFGNIFIHSGVKLGAHCTLRQGVTIGNRVEGGPVPVIEDDVEFGAYAQVLGGIRVGQGAKIGAMSVVLQDVPPGHTAVGIPARVIPPRPAAGAPA